MLLFLAHRDIVYSSPSFTKCNKHKQELVTYDVSLNHI